MQQLPRRWLFCLFLLSGFSGLVCQIVWLRLAFASFGIVTAVMSVLLSGFMLGLGLGSWLAGALVARWPWSWRTALRAYAAAEFTIGVGALTVPALFRYGAELLLPAGEADSFHYLANSAWIMLAALTPFCLCMGFTFPFMLQAIRADGGEQAGFSYLYLANVIGAMLGTFLAPVALVELFGFRGTLWIAAGANWTAAMVSVCLSLRRDRMVAAPQAEEPPLPTADIPAPAPQLAAGAPALLVLFTTGLTSMAIEVVWVRAFTPVLMTQVYSFASLLLTYLVATWVGSWWYRRHLAAGGTFTTRLLLSGLALAGFAQLLTTDPRLPLPPASWWWIPLVLLSIVPYCSILGYLTPKLIDEYSAGNPTSAGRAYAVNVLGCIIGPLLASYLLLPKLGVAWSTILLATPLWGLAGATLFGSRTAEHEGGFTRKLVWRTVTLWLAATGCGVVTAAIGTSFEDYSESRNALVLRDHTATVMAYDALGGKHLLVNGMPITTLTPSTKLMAHLPLCHLAGPPESALVICFGMGTTYRSLLSWDIDVTAVELVPSVREAFGWFYADAENVRNNPRGRIIIDDGRRYLRRTDQKFDVITLDPPPPVEAAGSSLLYSTEFYDLIKARLSDQGILQTWFPEGDLQTFRAVLRSLVKSFPHVRGLRSFNGYGFHILASMQPIPFLSAVEIAARLPEAATRDLMEWDQNIPHELFISLVANAQFNPLEVIGDDSSLFIADDRPINEYFVLRRARDLWNGTFTMVR